MQMPRIFTILCLIFTFSEVMAGPSYEQRENIVYAEVDGIGLIMDIFVPKGTPNGLAIVDVVSGAWLSSREKLEQHKQVQFYELLAQRGFVVFALRPGSITKFSGDEMLVNIRSGIRWVKAHAEEYHIAPERLGIIGASAGGHLASLIALRADNSTKVSAVAVFFPPTDLLNILSPTESNTESFQQSTALLSRLAFGADGNDSKKPEIFSSRLKQLSPVYHVSKAAPPFLLIHGDADPQVPLDQSKRLLAALENKGISVELIIKHGGGHAWPTIYEEVNIMADWLVNELSKK